MIPRSFGLGIFLLALFFSSLHGGNPVIFIYMVIAVIVPIYDYLSISMTSYELKADGLQIKTGVIGKSQTLLLYNQIQNVTEYQTFWSRILGLKTLQIQTMTAGSAAAGRLRDLKEEDADALKKALLQLVNQRSRPSHAPLEANQSNTGANPYPLHFTRLIFFWLLFAVIAIFAFSALVFIIIPQFDSADKALDLLKSGFGRFLMQMSVFILIIFFWLVQMPITLFIKQYTFKYWLGEAALTIKSGLISTQKTIIEYEKLQDFILSYGVIGRLLGIASVHVETGALEIVPSDGKNKQRPNFTIPALLMQDARKMALFLSQKIGITYPANKKPLIAYAPLSQKKPLKKTFAAAAGLMLIGALVAGGFVIYYAISGNLNFGAISHLLLLIFGIIFALLVAIYIYEVMYLKYYFYDWSPDAITIRKGVLGQRQIFLPFEKVQNVYLDMDLFDRIFGLRDIHFSTIGGGSFSMCHIDGLDVKTAEKLLPVLLKQVKANLRPSSS
jgi:uncharacterized membrane protein YdbT with pleckstrin-like domain